MRAGSEKFSEGPKFFRHIRKSSGGILKILVGIPEKFQVYSKCSCAAANLLRCGHELYYCDAEGKGVYGVAQARNNLAEKAVEERFDKLLMVDGDVVVPPDALRFLLDPPEPVVLGCYPFKDCTGDQVLFRPGRVGEYELPDGRFEVTWGGLGCALVDVGLFSRIPRPWFHWDEHRDGSHTGEDAWFCGRVRNLGVKVLADGRVRCGHVGVKSWW